ncbi:MAG: ABC-type transport auxiliary lipoprotein family protein [Syntrophales bacterium]|nr:ABC-type transport auxiliary lipoprotein family protein [Syntrophales bacterium]
MRRFIYIAGEKGFIKGSTGVVMVIIAAFAFAGCAGGRTATPGMTAYVLEHPEIRQSLSADDTLTSDTLTVLRFTATEACHGNSMLYRSSPYERAAYRYHRWKVSPAVMVTNYLAEDLLRGRIFRAVFTDYSYEKSRYHLEGRVMDCIEIIEAGRREVFLEFSAVLIDTNRKEAENRILFQNTYQHRRSIKGGGPAGTAAAMSEALAVLSEGLKLDILSVLGEGGSSGGDSLLYGRPKEKNEQP